MELVWHFRGQGLTSKDKLQGQISVGYRGHIVLFKMSIIKRFNYRRHIYLLEI